MTQPLLIITPCTRTTNAGTLDLLTSQLAAAEIPHHIHLMPSAPPLGWGMATKLAMYREWCMRFSEYENLVIADAFDVVCFAKSTEEIVRRIPRDIVLCAAEKNCYPDPSLTPAITARYPNRGDHRYFNGGLTAGTPDNIDKWLTLVERHPKYNPLAVDQWFFNEMLAEGSILATIDYRTALFYCLFCGYPELDFVNGEPVNRTYDTWPLFVHANGGWNPDEMWRKHEASK